MSIIVAILLSSMIGYTNQKTCYYFTSSDRIRCSYKDVNFSCSTQKPKYGKYLQKGFYRVGINKIHATHNSSWFNLYQYRNGEWWHYHQANPKFISCEDSGITQQHLKYNRKSIVPKNEQCWEKLETFLNETFEVKIFKADECYNCLYGLCLNHTAQVDHKYLTTLRVW